MAWGSCPSEQGVIRRTVVVPDCGGGVEVDGGRQSHTLPLLGDHSLREAAGPGPTNYAVPRAISPHLFANSDNDPRTLRARHKRCRGTHLIISRYQKMVHEAYRRGVHVD